MDWKEIIMKNFKEEDYKLLKNLDRMKTINNVSGGKTSAFIAANMVSDYTLFSLVRTNEKSCEFPDAKVRQIVSDRIGVEFIGTLEMDEIIYTILDLEQYIGREINWVSGDAFEDIIRKRKALPSVVQRYCTSELKIEPMKKWWYKNINEPVEVRIGFRANEMNRAKNMLEKCIDGFIYSKFEIDRRNNGRRVLKELKWQTPKFPLIEQGIFKDKIENYWEGKPVRFAYTNNCVGCFNRSPLLLNFMSKKDARKFDFFMNIEKEIQSMFIEKNGKESNYGRFLSQNLTYEKIKNHKLQLELFDNDFTDCDSGYCGL